MQNETAGTAFLKYGSVFRNFNEKQFESLISQVKRVTAQQSLSQFLHFSCDTYIEVQNGIGVLLVSEDPENSPIEEFGMNHRIHIKPNVYFGFVSTTPELTVAFQSARGEFLAVSSSTNWMVSLPSATAEM